jgi:hypothetical protein
VTAIFLAWNGNTVANKTLQEWDWVNKPLHILVAFPYLRGYKKERPSYGEPLCTMLDSGAFSAWKSGHEVDIDELIHEVKIGGWDESVALDVIGDSAGSVKNAFYMKEAGIDVIPVFHYGEDWGVLAEYCHNFAHVGLSCRFGEANNDSIRWVEQCFARHWPHCFHSFGWISEKILDRVPFDTADAATWQLAPAAYGVWKSYNGAKLSIPSSLTTGVRFTTEIEHYLNIQLRLEERWKKELTPIRQSSLGSRLASRRMLSTWSPGKDIAAST